MNKIVLLFECFLVCFKLSAQFAPAAGQAGSTAIPYDSSCFVAWATHVEISRGYININDTNATYQGSNRASFGAPNDACGSASNVSTDVVSLGDSGIAIVSFANGIQNDVGYDFAVFENGVTDNFLELALVEVSSDGLRFVRFPSKSLTQTSTQIGSFGTVDPQKLYNLAGKYRVGFGTPFDLEELKDSAGIDINDIRYVRLIDAVGSVGSHATFDALGNKINELFPTPFNSGGFDLNAVGVIHEKPAGIEENSLLNLSVYPNPAKNEIYINNIPDNQEVEFQLFNSIAKLEMAKKIEKSSFFSLHVDLAPGLYFLHLSNENFHLVRSIVIQ